MESSCAESSGQRDRWTDGLILFVSVGLSRSNCAFQKSFVEGTKEGQSAACAAKIEDKQRMGRRPEAGECQRSIFLEMDNAEGRVASNKKNNEIL